MCHTTSAELLCRKPRRIFRIAVTNLLTPRRASLPSRMTIISPVSPAFPTPRTRMGRREVAEENPLAGYSDDGLAAKAESRCRERRQQDLVAELLVAGVHRRHRRNDGVLLWLGAADGRVTDSRLWH